MGHHITSHVPPHHPIDDVSDATFMVTHSVPLAMALTIHLASHVGLAINNVLALRHMSPLLCSLCDFGKLAVLWVAGKFFWFSGSFLWPSTWPNDGGAWAVLAEPWQPHSWLMIPILCVMGYAMLMFKLKVFNPIELKCVNGRVKLGLHRFQSKEELQDPFKHINVGLEEFYYEPFAKKKIKVHLQRKMSKLLEEVRADSGEQAADRSTRSSTLPRDGGGANTASRVANVWRKKANSESGS